MAWSATDAQLWAVLALSGTPVINRPQVDSPGLWHENSWLTPLTTNYATPPGDEPESAANIVVVAEHAWTIPQGMKRQRARFAPDEQRDLEARSLDMVTRQHLDFAIVTWACGPRTQTPVALSAYPSVADLAALLPDVAYALAGVLCGDQ